MKKRKALIVTIFISILVLVSLIIYKLSKTNDINSINLKEIKYEDFNLTSDDYLEDFNYTYDIIEEYYPFLEINKKQNGIDWLSKKEIYQDYILDSKNDDDFYNRMNDILSELNNEHTHLIPKNYGLSMYLAYYSIPSLNWRHDISEIYEKDRVRSRYKISNNSINTYIKRYSDSKNSDLNDYENLSTEIVRQSELAYIKVNTMLPEFYMKNDEKILVTLLDQIKDYPYLIIDIRGNSGGDSSYWHDFLIPKIIDKDYQTTYYNFIKSGPLNTKIIKQEGFKEGIDAYLKENNIKNDNDKFIKDFDYYSRSSRLVKPDKDSIKFKGKIYLLVDEYVYSSSEMFASFCKETGLATLVGTKTGGDGIGFDPMQVDLPKSGYMLRFPNTLGITESGSINEMDKTMPDIIVDYTNKDSNMKLKDQDIIKAVIKDAGLN